MSLRAATDAGRRYGFKGIGTCQQPAGRYYQKNKNFGFVIPDDQKIAKDIFIPQGCDMGAVTGHKVVVKVTDFGDERKKPEGRIKEILGHVNDPGTDILSWYVLTIFQKSFLRK